jgi:hypothetical protein
MISPLVFLIFVELDNLAIWILASHYPSPNTSENRTMVNLPLVRPLHPFLKVFAATDTSSNSVPSLPIG